MLRLILAAFVIIPIIEIGLFILLGQLIGFWPTLLGILVTAAIGSAVLRFQGASLIAEIRSTVGRGVLPGRALAEAMMLGMAGVLMVTPGYFTDFVGFLLLIPPVRGFVYDYLKRHVSVVAGSRATSAFGGVGPRAAPDDVVDLDTDEWRPR